MKNCDRQLCKHNLSKNLLTYVHIYIFNSAVTVNYYFNVQNNQYIRYRVSACVYVIHLNIALKFISRLIILFKRTGRDCEHPSILFEMFFRWILLCNFVRDVLHGQSKRLVIWRFTDDFALYRFAVRPLKMAIWLWSKSYQRVISFVHVHVYVYPIERVIIFKSHLVIGVAMVAVWCRGELYN